MNPSDGGVDMNRVRKVEFVLFPPRKSSTPITTAGMLLLRRNQAASWHCPVINLVGGGNLD